MAERSARLLRDGKRPRRFLSDFARIVLGCAIVIGVAVRIAYFSQLSTGPCLWQHRWDQSDMAFFDKWAKIIAAGDWLTDRELHAEHSWHRDVAQQYFRSHADVEATLRAQGSLTGKAPFQLLWDRWYGGKRFHQEPLYPYLLAVFYGLFGPEVRWVFLGQMLAGVFNIVLLYRIARRCFGPAAGATAALLAALCGPLVYYELILLRETLLVTLTLASVLLTLRLEERRDPWSWFATGAVCGLSLLIKSSLALYWLPVIVVLAFRSLRSRTAFLKLPAALICGAALCLAPVAARNIAVAVAPTELSSVGTITFVCTNAEDYEPGAGFWISWAHAARIMGETGGRFLPAAIATLRTHPGLGSYLASSARKLNRVFSWYEVPNNTNFYYYRLHAGVLRFLPVTFLLLAPLGLVGMAIAVAAWRQCWPLHGMGFANVAILLAFGVLSRLRIPLAAVLIPFAALTLVRTAEWIRSRRYARAGVATACAALLLIWTSEPLPSGTSEIRVDDYFVAYIVYYRPAVAEAAAAHDPGRAADILLDSLRVEPRSLGELGPARAARDSDEASLAGLYGEVRDSAAGWLEKAGRLPEAARQRQRATELHAASRRGKGSR